MQMHIAKMMCLQLSSACGAIGFPHFPPRLSHRGVPHGVPKAEVCGVRELHAIGPLPLVHDEEKARDEHVWGRIGIQLAHARHKHGPCDTAKEAQYIGIHPAHCWAEAEIACTWKRCGAVHETRRKRERQNGELRGHCW